ncbi:hypothetical protein [Dactylosporangium darangshiense]|uniref:hypothetical protein n=1 Tax=Dactylosporangium darangshiense TaxID=579108 RepID=UPI0031F080EE
MVDAPVLATGRQPDQRLAVRHARDDVLPAVQDQQRRREPRCESVEVDLAGEAAGCFAAAGALGKPLRERRPNGRIGRPVWMDLYAADGPLVAVCIRRLNAPTL